jgi:hypothetical protein
VFDNTPEDTAAGSEEVQYDKRERKIPVTHCQTKASQASQPPSAAETLNWAGLRIDTPSLFSLALSARFPTAGSHRVCDTWANPSGSSSECCPGAAHHGAGLLPKEYRGHEKELTAQAMPNTTGSFG